MLRQVGDRILVCEPNEGTWLENMVTRGQRVFMSSAAPYLYQVPGWRPMREYTELALAGDAAGAAQVAATLEPVRAVADTWLHGEAARRRGSPVPYIKAWAGLLGMSGGPVRPPLTQVSPADLAALAADLNAAGLPVRGGLSHLRARRLAGQPTSRAALSPSTRPRPRRAAERADLAHRVVAAHIEGPVLAGRARPAAAPTTMWACASMITARARSAGDRRRGTAWRRGHHLGRVVAEVVQQHDRGVTRRARR